MDILIIAKTLSTGPMAGLVIAMGTIVPVATRGVQSRRIECDRYDGHGGHGEHNGYEGYGWYAGCAVQNRHGGHARLGGHD